MHSSNIFTPYDIMHSFNLPPKPNLPDNVIEPNRKLEKQTM